MDVLDAVKGRRGIREFQDRPISDAALGDLIEALRWAPSAGNLQSRKFYLVFNEALRSRLAAAAGSTALAARLKKAVKTVLGRNALSSAPLVIVACLDRSIAARYGDRGERLYAIQDVALSLMTPCVVEEEGPGILRLTRERAEGGPLVVHARFDARRLTATIEAVFAALRPDSTVPLSEDVYLRSDGQPRLDPCDPLPAA